MIDMIVMGMTRIAIIVAFIRYDGLRDASFQKEREEWAKERQHLLDRIQAPSYDHLKHHEAKIIKAQKEEPKDKVTLEVV